MRIPCSNCGRAVRVRVNDNGEINCPRCGASLLVLPEASGIDAPRPADPPMTLDPEGILTTPRTSPVVIAAAIAIVALIAAALALWLRS
jgi:DNA-directed RNA polymerase subunit RPC12/RpoP